MSPGSQTMFGDLRFHVDENNLRIRADQLRARLRLYPTMAGGQALLAPMFVRLLWDQAPHRVLLIWLSSMLAMHAVEMLVWWRYHKQTGSVGECRAWNRRFILMTTAVGLLWGCTALWFFPPELAYQAMLICVMLGLAAGAVTMNPVYPPALYIYVLCVTLPLIFRVLAEDDATHFTLVGMLLLFLVVILNAGRELSKIFLASLWQRYENLSLVEQLTEQKDRADQARDEAMVSSRDKSRFLAAASHDLRQPLQALVLFNEALQDVAKDEETRHLSRQIGSSVSALMDMFNELLDVSRLDAGVVEARWQHFELQPLFDRLLVDFSPIAHAKGLGFEIQASGRVLYSDPNLLERILRNLVSNAIRYTEQGKVSLRHHVAGGKLRLEVADTGMGMGQEVLPHIFEEYYQADNPQRDRRKGLGLGLAIVRRIEDLLGCKVAVESVPGKGSVFSLSVDFGEEELLAHQRVNPHVGYDLSGTVVALVEDESEIRQLLVSLMEQWGCRVMAGVFSDEVIEKMNAAGMRPDLLVCDYRLPQGVTAVHVIKRMRELWGNDIPALVLTGDTAPEVLREIQLSDATLLHKPVRPPHLRSLMYLALQDKCD